MKYIQMGKIYYARCIRKAPSFIAWHSFQGGHMIYDSQNETTARKILIVGILFSNYKLKNMLHIYQRTYFINGIYQYKTYIIEIYKKITKHSKVNRVTGII